MQRWFLPWKHWREKRSASEISFREQRLWVLLLREMLTSISCLRLHKVDLLSLYTHAYVFYSTCSSLYEWKHVMFVSATYKKEGTVVKLLDNRCRLWALLNGLQLNIKQTVIFANANANLNFEWSEEKESEKRCTQGRLHERQEDGD